jgi:hypothetical protein
MTVVQSVHYVSIIIHYAIKLADLHAVMNILFMSELYFNISAVSMTHFHVSAHASSERLALYCSFIYVRIVTGTGQIPDRCVSNFHGA